MNYNKIALFPSRNPKAQAFADQVKKQLGVASLEEADCIVVIGGDGFMLHALHNLKHLDIPFFGIHAGTVGFLMNNVESAHLIDKIQEAEVNELYPLRMTAIDIHGHEHAHNAINEVSLMRQSPQAGKIKISVDGIERMPELVSDGVLVSTPAGSTAYNLSAHGPIFPLSANLLALTPISPFRPRRWRGALLPSSAKICFTICDAKDRPVSASADYQMVDHVKQVIVEQNRDNPFRVLFTRDHDLEDRILSEQFSV